VWTERSGSAAGETTAPGRRSRWTSSQLADFLDAVVDDRLLALWWLIALRGLRRGEAAGLRWCDLDLDRRRVSIVST